MGRSQAGTFAATLSRVAILSSPLLAWQRRQGRADSEAQGLNDESTLPLDVNQHVALPQVLNG